MWYSRKSEFLVGRCGLYYFFYLEANETRLNIVRNYHRVTILLSSIWREDGNLGFFFMEGIVFTFCHL